MKIMLNIIQIHEEVKLKTSIMKPLIERILQDQTSKKFIDAEKITHGFFYTFIYKDFILRELISNFLKLGS